MYGIDVLSVILTSKLWSSTVTKLIVYYCAVVTWV